jgi:TRAP-type mannitol/chloroaromatic compound transport system substrate-binding protein
MEAAYKATNELIVEYSQKSADFAKMYASWSKFRDDQSAWYRVADHYLDTYTLGQQARKKG